MKMCEEDADMLEGDSSSMIDVAKVVHPENGNGRLRESRRGRRSPSRSLS